MKLNIYRTIWGMEGFSNAQESFKTLQKLKQKGYNGIEVAIAFTENRDSIVQQCKDLDLGIITQIHTCGYPISHSKVKDHIESLKKQCDEALKWNPVLINCHGGKDSWDEHIGLEFFYKAMQFQKTLPKEMNNGQPLAFETHRMRTLFTPWITKKLLDQVQGLRLNLDISHWHVVTERTLEKQIDPEWETVFQQVQQRSIQIHARIASSQMIQVNDPKQPEHQQDVDWYRKIWSKVLNAQKEKGVLNNFYITTEFGPFPYQPVAPFSMEALSDLEEANDWMKNKLQKDFNQYL